MRCIAVMALCLSAPAFAKSPPTYPLAARALVLDAVAVDGVIVAAADRGLILRSSDDGATWSRIVPQLPAPVMLTALAFQGRRGFAVGHDATILVSDDAGATWAVRHQKPELEIPLFAVWAESDQHAIAAGGYGLLVETRDGGATWTERRISEDEPHIYALTAVGNALYAVGEQGAIFRSADAGATWETLPSPYKGTWFGALALKDGGLLVYGLRGNLHRTDNGGGSWTRIETGTEASLLGALARADGSVVVVGLSGTTLTSGDGHRFTLSSLDNREALGGAFEDRNGRLMLFGEKGLHPAAETPK